MTQIILWILLIGPWFILPFLESKRVKHFISAAFFTILLTSIFWQAAEVYNWWIVDENLPFLSGISAFNYGLLPVVTILVFYYFYENALKFFIANAVIDAIQAFIINPYLFQKLRFYHMVNMSNLGLFILLIALVPAIYLYQVWYEKQTVTAMEF